ncbi:hypothetical protein NGB36_26075 [Streptomyces sp. RB6PN25]|uniref:SH3b domain-containing protein n=1 Tax=Streptomyces humicola TaxID=2953240 RepID=A0ABT1Q217_9ACTN|nr:hypothetical protein [Streptomyces humicola]MCQ4083959.1 hypothetical protein [Streptomyces humicola]
MMNRHSIGRAAAAVLLTGGVAAGVVAGAVGAQADSAQPYAAVQGSVVTPAPLNVRYGPGTDHWISSSLGNGTSIWIACKSEGTNIGGNNRWYQLTNNQGWVSAHYVNTNGYVPWCDSQG